MEARFKRRGDREIALLRLERQASAQCNIWSAAELHVCLCGGDIAAAAGLR
jgi:hypothetical protein